MPVRIGDTEPDTFYLGASELDALYLGSNLLWQNFTPVDMTWNMPGTYTLNIGKGTHVYISGRGADGGSGAGGGGTGDIDFDTPQQDTTLAGGNGGSGNGGPDGQDGDDGVNRRRSNNNFDVFSGGGGGGEGGETPVNASVSRLQQTDFFVAQSGRGGNGGDGADSPHTIGSTTPVHGGSGGVPIGGTNTTNRTGRAAGIGGPSTEGFPSGGGGEQGFLGELIGERLFTDIPQDIVLTIVVPEHGDGSSPGTGGEGAGTQNGSAGTMGMAGENDGWIRIRVTRE